MRKVIFAVAAADALAPALAGVQCSAQHGRQLQQDVVAAGVEDILLHSEHDVVAAGDEDILLHKRFYDEISSHLDAVTALLKKEAESERASLPYCQQRSRESTPNTWQGPFKLSRFGSDFVTEQQKDQFGDMMDKILLFCGTKPKEESWDLNCTHKEIQVPDSTTKYKDLSTRISVRLKKNSDEKILGIICGADESNNLKFALRSATDAETQKVVQTQQINKDTLALRTRVSELKKRIELLDTSQIEMNIRCEQCAADQKTMIATKGKAKTELKNMEQELNNMKQH